MQLNGPELSLALVGVGGYGNIYLSHLFQQGVDGGVRLVAVADKNPSSCQHLPEIHRRNIPLYDSLESLQANHSCGLTILCTPPQWHCEQAVSTLANGSHVLCEKPLATTPNQGWEMIQARDQAGKQVSIGYQWCFSSGIQAIKRDIAAGLFGRPRRLKALVMWPRDEGYYTRNDWAGRLYGRRKELVFDNPLNNACAHHIHNMLYVLGSQPDRSAMPVSFQAELYRANNIDTFDTAAVRVLTDSDAEVLCYVTHASRAERGPGFCYEFEDATIEFSGNQPGPATKDGARPVARFKDGRMKEYDSPERAPANKLWAAVESARSNTPTVCGIEASLPHTLLMAAMQRTSSPRVFPAAMIRSEMQANGRLRKWADGLDEALLKCYSRGTLPFEMKFPWAVEGAAGDVAERTFFSPDLSPKTPERLQVYPFGSHQREPV